MFNFRKIIYKHVGSGGRRRDGVVPGDVYIGPVHKTEGKGTRLKSGGRQKGLRGGRHGLGSRSARNKPKGINYVWIWDERAGLEAESLAVCRPKASTR